MTRIASSTDSRPLPSLWLLWFGLLAPPLAWMAHLTVGYFLVTIECRYDITAYDVLIDATSVGFFVLSILGGTAAFAAFRRLRQQEDGLGESGRRALFMASAGLVLCALFTVAIVFGNIPALFLSPCNDVH